MAVKNILGTLFALIASFSGINRANPGILKFITNFSYIGPFEQGADDYTLTGLVKPTVTLSNVKEYLRVFVIDGPVVKSEMTNYHKVTRNSTYTLTFKLPFKSALTKRGLKVYIDFIDGDDMPLQSFSFNIMPIQPERIHPQDYIDEYYSVTDIIVDPDNYTASISEKYKFDLMLDYFNTDNYYRLSLNDLVITYESSKECPAGLAHLHFVDYLKLFPYLDNDNTVPEFDIPLTIIQSNNRVLFSFPSKMYVKPGSLEMSLDARPGFVETSYFYLPVNHCQDLLGQTFTLEAESFGHNRNSFSWDIRYINNRSLLGDCHNSDYCVVGEINNG